VLTRFLARQFGRPSGWIGRVLIGPWLDRISRGMNRLTIEQLRLARGDAVLEVGFGGGDLVAMMFAAGAAKLTGVDISEAMVRRAERRFRREIRAGRLSLYQASAERLPVPDAAFDKAVSLNSLYFWSNPEAAFAELARVLPPGGRLVIAFEPPEELSKWPGHRHGFRVYKVEEVRGLMEAASFGDIQEAWGTGRKPDRFCALSGTRLGANG
jgi:ubiquinone/menaquinone biosynthesis C-methylase UbiE